ncbi:MAG: glycosyltransferase [Microbacterium sp.]
MDGSSSAAAAPPAPREVDEQQRGHGAEAPTLSIVMPVYNVAPYLESALLSVLYQEFEDFELIVVDDASTDGSRRIIDMYAERDPRVRVVHLETNSLGGAGAPSNAGLRVARGRYLGFVDSDDILMRGVFARMIEVAEGEAADVVIGGFETFEEGSREVSPAYDLPRASGIPRGRPVSAATHPALLALSPVPWRKLYRMSFMESFAIEYPEGDYLFEDNALHWTVLAYADRVVVIDDIVCMHRMGREGQTMGAAQYRKGAYAHHYTTALRAALATTGARREALLQALLERLHSSRWIVRDQTQISAQAMISRRFAALVDRAVDAGAEVPPQLKRSLDSYRGAYPALDLTVVLTTFDCVHRLRRTLDPLLTMSGIDFDVLVVDQGSADGTVALLREYESTHGNLHVFEHRTKSTGRARNSVIPLLAGRFTFFMDAGDTIDPTALADATKRARADDVEVLVVRYGTTRKSGVVDGDQAAWSRIVSTRLIQDENIFFGGEGAGEDQPFVARAIASAQKVGSSELSIVTRHKFTSRRQAAQA